MYIPRIVVTSGEPAGVGPDACVTLAQSDWEADLVVAADSDLLLSTADALGLPLQLEAYDASKTSAAHRAGVLKVMHIPLARRYAPVIPIPAMPPTSSRCWIGPAMAARTENLPPW